MRIERASWSFLAVVLAASGCGTGAAGEAVRPEAPTASQALDGPEAACTAVASKSSPLVVDLPSQDRVALEVAMKDGVSVVKYSCEGLEVLRDCHASGEYRFAGVSMKEDVVRFLARGSARTK